MTEPIDQATKDLIEKEAISYVIKETGYQILPEHDHWKKAYIAGATNSFKYLEKLLNEKLYKEVESLREQLAKERELRKELIDGLSNIEFDIKADVRSYTLTSHTETLFNALKKIESLTQKAKRQKS